MWSHFGNEHLPLCPACCLATSSGLEYKCFILPLVCLPEKISSCILDPLGLWGALAGQFKIGSGGYKGMDDYSGVCIRERSVVWQAGDNAHGY